MGAIAAAALVTVAASCTERNGSPTVGSVIATDASETAFRAWAGKDLEIRTFHSMAKRAMKVPDRFRNVMYLTIEDADVEVRYTRGVQCFNFNETVDRMLGQNGSVGMAMSEITRERVLGAGIHPEGQVDTLHVSVLHEWTGTDWRFLAVDRRFRDSMCGQ